MLMQHRARMFLLVFAAMAGPLLASPAFAQASAEQPNSGNVAQQFNSGANYLGHGASQIGEGIKNGAIMTWQAFRDGAYAFAGRFNGASATP